MATLPDRTVQKARDAAEALIDASKVVLHDLRHNQRDLEHLLDELDPGPQEDT